MGLTKEQILGTKPPVESVGWIDGGTVSVSAMSGTDRDSFERESVTLTDDGDQYGFMDNFRARLLVRCLVDDDGVRMFADIDADELGRVWCKPLDEAFAVGKRINGFTDADIEELAKNSDGAPNDSSGTT